MGNNEIVASAEKPRILHILGSLTLGGIETWLVHMLRHHERFDVQHEILLTKEDAGAYEPEIRSLGIRIHRIPLRNNKAGWFAEFRRLLLDEGPFAAIHSHATPVFAAPALAAAKRAGVPVRIAHSHSARSQGADYPLKYRIGRRIAMLWLKRAATRRIGISEASIKEIAGTNWRMDPAASILLYGFDFDRNRGGAERAKILRQKLGIPEDSPVVGNVARFNPVKNHDLLLKAFAACKREVHDAHLVMVGTGPLQSDVETLAENLGLKAQTHFAGTTDDVPAYMAMFDLFALPSFSEGLGIVCVEAQAAGTRALVSDTTPAEATVIPGAVETLPLDAGASGWGASMARLLALPPPDPAEWLRQVEQSKFGIQRCLDDLNDIYLAEIERTA